MKRILIALAVLCGAAAANADTGITLYDNTTHYMQIHSPASYPANYRINVPLIPGTTGQVMSIQGVSGTTIQTIFTTPSSGGGGGASTLAVFNGVTQISSPTIAVAADGVSLTAYAIGTSSAGFKANPSSATLQGNQYSIAGIAASTGTLTTQVAALTVSTTSLGATVASHTTALASLLVSTTSLQTQINAVAVSTGVLSVSTISLQSQISGLGTTYLTNSSATLTYLQGSSATATYLSIPVAASTYLTQSSATATYFQKTAIIPIANGGTNTASTLTGIVRGGAAYTASELSGDATTSGSNAVTLAAQNGNLKTLTSSFTVTNAGGMNVTYGVIAGSGTFQRVQVASNTILGAGTTIYTDGRGVFGGPLSATNLSGTNTGDQTITLTGDVTGSGTGSFAATLAASGVTASTYGSSTVVPVLTVDSKGRVTAVSSATVSGGSGSSLPLPAGATNYVQISPTTQQTGNLSVSSATIGADASLSGFTVTSTGSWAHGNAMPFTAQYGAYVKLTCGPNAGKEVYCGGANTAGTPNLNCAIFDPATNVWISTTAQTNAHWLGAMLVTPDCNILNIGGLDTSRTVTNKTDVLNTTTWVWSSSATLPAAWAGMGAGVLPNGQILAGGGNKFSTVNYSSQVYLLQSGSYISTTSLPSTMAYPSVAKMKNGGLLFSGGDVNDSTVGSTSTYFLNGQWIIVNGFTGLSTSFNGANEAIDSTGLIYLITGSGPPLGAASQVSEVLNQNVTPLSWVQISSYPLATVCAGVFAEPNDRIICTYGVHSGHFAGSTTYEYDKLTLAWTQAGDLPALKGYVSFNQTGPQPVLNDGRFVLPAGSDDSANSTSSVQIYSPTLYVPSTFTAIGIVAKNISVTNNLNAGNITGASLSTCGDATHALGYAAGTGLFSCQSVTGSGGGSSASSGTVVQVVSSNTITAFSTTSTSFAQTYLGATITPRAATDILIIHVAAPLSNASAAAIAYATLSRGATNLLGSNGQCSESGLAAGAVPCSMVWVDTGPLTTSATTYFIQAMTSNGAFSTTWGATNQTQTMVIEEINPSGISSGTISLGGANQNAYYPSNGNTISPDVNMQVWPSSETHTGSGGLGVTYGITGGSITANTQLVVPVQAGALPTVNGDIRYDSTAGAYRGYSGVIGSSIAFVTTLYSSAPINSDILVSTTITTTETAFNTQFTFPSNYFTVGKTIRITVGVDYVATATIPTMLAKIRFQKSGPTNVNLYTGGANAGTATAAYSLSRGLSLTVTCAATGSSGQFQMIPIYTAPPFNNTTIAGSVSADTTAAQTLQVTLTFGASSSSNFTRLNSFVIEALN